MIKPGGRRRISRGAVALCALLLAASALCADAPSLRVGAGVVTPPTGDWQQELTADGSAARFTRAYKWLGQPKGSTQIVVFAQSVAKEAGDDPASVAAQFFEQEERIMREQGVAAGDYKLSKVVRGTRTVDGRQVLTLTYHKDLAVMRFGRQIEEARLSLWFPDGFATTRECYGFLISEMRQKGAMVDKADLGLIDPVIANFRVELTDEAR